MSENVVNLQLAASALTSWKAGKHGMEYASNDFEDHNPTKRARVDNSNAMMYGTSSASMPMNTTHVPGKPVLKPYPFFFYNDCSQEQDPDPLTPLTFPGRVANFPAKLHAILSESGLEDIIDWLPHGRAWRVLKPREFETKVIGRFFEHSKYSSFVRQANGWGFRRITQGPDRNAYYHEKFLRGLPHLCKSMKRPGVAEKRIQDPDLEPDFYKISELHPLPAKSDEESIFLNKTLQSGPKSRMPIITGHFNKSSDRSQSPASSTEGSDNGSTLSPTEVTNAHQAPSAHPYSGTEVKFTNVAPQVNAVSPHTSNALQAQAHSIMASRQAQANNNMVSHAHRISVHQGLSDLSPSSSISDSNSSRSPETQTQAPDMSQLPFPFPMPVLDGNNAASSSFAAGFAAAAAHYQKHFHAMLNSMAQNKQQLPEGVAQQNTCAGRSG